MEEAAIFRIVIEPAKQKGISRLSQAMIDKIMPVRKDRIHDVISEIDRKLMKKLEVAITAFLGIAWKNFVSNCLEERKRALAKMLGIDKKIWVRIGDCDPVHPITNEYLDRETEDKTSAVHFMRFELTPDMVKKAKAGAKISMSIDHPAYQHSLDPILENIRQSLVNDWD